MKYSKFSILRIRLLNSLYLVAIIAIIAFYSRLIISANLDLIDGRFALFMDERITFDGVKRILHPDGFIEFVVSVIYGGDLRYGRSLWNSIAFFSAIPERLYGDTGQIIAARLLQAGLIFSSYFIFAFGVLRSWFSRLVLLITMLSIPYANYYMTMPKPEPLQLLFLATFSYFYIKRNAAFSWYWIFLGLAFGTKISTLPAVLVFIFVSLLNQKNDDIWAVNKKSFINAALAFLLGLALAVPILFIPLLISAGGFLLFDRITKKYCFKKMASILISMVIFFFIFLASKKIIYAWFGSTFLNTSHGADKASINAISWLGYFFNEWLIAPYILGLIFFAAIVGFMALHAIQIFKSYPVIIDKNVMVFAICLAGIAMNLAIMISAKRLWGFYLYPGTLLMAMGVIALADRGDKKSTRKKSRFYLFTNKLMDKFIAVIFLVISAIYWIPSSIDGLKDLSQRTKTLEYTLQYESYKATLHFLENYKRDNDKRLRVMFSPVQFTPNSNDKYSIIEFWGAYNNWNDSLDVIVLSEENIYRTLLPPEDSPEYHQFLAGLEGYLAHVSDNGETCKSYPCFNRALKLPDGGEILVLAH